MLSFRARQASYRVNVVESYAELREAPIVDGRVYTLLGRETPGDDGAGTFDCTDDNLTTPIANDPLYGHFVKHATLAASAGGFRRRGSLYRSSPGFFGAKGDAVADDHPATQGMANFLGASFTGKHRGGTGDITRRHALGDTLLLASRNVRLRGLGTERGVAGASSQGASLLIGTKTTGPIVRVRESDIRLEGFEIRSSAARLAGGVSDTGEAIPAGVYVAPTDGGAGISRIRFKEMLFRDNFEDGFHVAGDVVRMYVEDCGANVSGRHGGFIDDGTLNARANKARPGQIYVNVLVVLDSQGYNFCAGNPSETASGAPYRVLGFGIESIRGGINSAKCFAGMHGSVLLSGEQVITDLCGFSGTTTGNVEDHAGLILSAAVAKMGAGNRYVNCGGDAYVIIPDNPNYTESHIEFEGAVAATDPSALPYFAKIHATTSRIRFPNTRNTAKGFTTLTDKDTLTIASGAVRVMLARHILSAETGTADDLTTLNGGVPGDRAILTATPGHTITVKNTANIACTPDRILTGDAMMEVECNAAGTGWRCISYEGNA